MILPALLLLAGALHAAPAANPDSQGVLTPGLIQRLDALAEQARWGEVAEVLERVVQDRRKLRGPGYLSVPLEDILKEALTVIDVPARVRTLAWVGGLYARLDRTDKALEALEPALKKEKKGPGRIALLLAKAAARIRADDGKAASYAAAKPLYEEATRLSGKVPGAGAFGEFGSCFSQWHMWVYGGREEKDWSQARIHCGSALRSSPGRRTVAAIEFVMGSLFADHKDVREAREHWQLSLDLYEEIQRGDLKNAQLASRITVLRSSLAELPN